MELEEPHVRGPEISGEAFEKVMSRSNLFGWRDQSFGAIGHVLRAKGATLYDQRERPVLDFASGQVNVNLGHGHPYILNAMREQLEVLCYTAPSLNTDVRERLSAKINEIIPFKEHCKIFLCNSGSEAVESAVKIAWALTGRRKIYTSSHSYHGATIAASSISGDARRMFAEPGIAGTRLFTSPFCNTASFEGLSQEDRTDLAIRLLEDQITQDGPASVAALFMEPVIGSGGVYSWPTRFVKAARQLCTRHGILLVFDETMSGWGRTGKWFAAEHHAVEPDIVTTAKGITSGYVPMAAVIVPQNLAARFEGRPLVCGSTTEGHALACATALACIETYHRENVIDRARETGRILSERLAEINQRHPCVKAVRSVGMLAGVELHDAAVLRHGTNWSEVTTKSLWARGVFNIVRGNVIMVAPPLNIETIQFENGIKLIRDELYSNDTAMR